MDDASGVPRRTIDELKTRYTLEPTLKDLYVEGVTDRDTYGWFLRESECKDVTIFEINSVDVPRELVNSHGLGGGHRNRVIALALELDREFPTVRSHVRCIADSDFDFILRSRTEPRHLLYTDYTSIELYAYGKATLEDIMTQHFSLNQSEVLATYQSMSRMLRELFLIRASNQLLDWGMKLVSFTRCCELRGTSIAFDREEFVTRCLNAASKSNRRNTFNSTYSTLSAVRLNDIREGIRGKDYTELLGWILHERANWQADRSNDKAIMQILLPTLEANRLLAEPLFSQIANIYS